MIESWKTLAALSVAVGAAVGGNLMAIAAPADADPIHGHSTLEQVGAEPNRVAHQSRGGDEQKYLADMHRIAPGLGKSDSQLIADGWKACASRRAGHESIDLPGVAAVETAYALTDLCP